MRVSPNLSHKHHIIPKHEWLVRFGNLLGFNSEDNVVWLSLEQHIQAHQLLYELNNNEYDRIAYLGLSGNVGKEEITTTLQSLGGKLGGSKSRGMKRAPQSEAHKKKISMARRNAWKNPTSKMLLGIQKMASSKTGAKLSAERRKQISNSLLGNTRVLGKTWKWKKHENTRW